MFPMPMQFMQQPMPPQPAKPDSSSSSSSSESDSASDVPAKSYNKSDTAALTTSATVLWKLPRKRLLQLTEGATELDPTVTGSLDQKDLCKLVFLFTRIRWSAIAPQVFYC
jgi:hypothetical protein